MVDLVPKLNLKNICVLDPDGKETLSKKSAQEYQYFLFGGILGNDPPQKRTGPELTSRLNINPKDVYNIGPKQMSTDTAVLVVKEINDGKEFHKLQFKDGICIEINDSEAVDLPYRYRMVEGKPWLSPELVQFLKKRKSF